MQTIKIEKEKGAAVRFVAYYRVSTERQGRSGLGLDAQRACVAAHLKGSGGVLVGEFTESESGLKDYRPKLDEALKAAKRQDATLIVAKLDRLSRSAYFVHKLRESGAAFFACDLPVFNALTVGIFAAANEYTVEQIKENTRAALERKRASVGEWRVSNLTKEAREMGAERMQVEAFFNPENQRAAALLCELNKRPDTLTLQAKADALNHCGFMTPKGGAWGRVQVSRLERKLPQYARFFERQNAEA